MAERPIAIVEDSAIPAIRTQLRGQSALSTAWHEIWKFARNKPLGAAGALILILMIITAIGADWIAPYDPVKPDTSVALQGPSLDHPMGTDQLGRDMLSRIIHGTRTSLYTGLMVVIAASMLGMLLGATSAYMGGSFDLIVQRFVDALLAFPGIIFSLTFLTIFSSGLHIAFIDLPTVWQSTPLMIVIALTIVFIPGSSRIVRGATFAIVNSQYVDAARATGCTTPRIILRHIIPNIFPVVIVIASVQLGNVILIESSLSFLGLGLPPPHPSWGGMLTASGRQFMEIAPWLAIFPGIAISLAVLAFNLFGDAMRDVLDPRLRGSSGSGLRS
ncbi:MAG TPA: ABC transporter permease [Dehalococcoidia bacterium]|nr:ABC transporter permease [Dehalococcoidia bacterium]